MARGPLSRSWTLGPGGGAAGRLAEAADQPEMDVQDRRALPVVEEMFAMRLDLLEDVPVERRGDVGLPALGRGHADRVADQSRGVIQREAMNGVALGHACF